MTTLFISDLHLDTKNPINLEKLINLLQTEALDADALYILGDLFEAWIGDDDHNAFTAKIKTALSRLYQTGVPIYLMRGNRDFFIGKRFAEEASCKILSDPHTINLYDETVVLTHGDLLCTDDVAYQRLRKITNNRLLQKIFLSLPLSWRRKVSIWVRNKSQKAIKNLDRKIMDVNAEAVNAMLNQHQADLIIHGHTHRPNIEYFTLNHKQVCRIVLSDWHQQGNVLRCYNDGKKELVYF